MNAFRRPDSTVTSGCRIGAPVQKMPQRCERRWARPEWTDGGYALAGAKGLEGNDGGGVLNAGNDLHLLVDEMADVGVFINVELDQQIVIPCGGIYLGGDFGFGQCVGDGVGLTEFAFDLDEEGNHRCRLRKEWH